MPRGFRFPYEADVWVPVVVNAADASRDFAVFGRLRPGVPLARARAELAALSANIRRVRPESLPGYAIGVRTLRANLLGNENGPALALASTVGFLLLLACANVATLLMARSAARRKEFVLRSVLGAGRGRQLRQMLTESTILALLGGALGVLLAVWCSRFTGALLPENYSRQLGIDAPAIDLHVLLLAVAAAVATGIVVGLVPAVPTLRNASAVLRQGGRSGRADGAELRTTLDRFAIGQLALALVLLGAAGALLEGLHRQQHRDLGFAPAQLLTLVMTPSVTAHPRDAARAALARRLLDDIGALPGVRSAAVTSVNPLTGTRWLTTLLLEGRGSSDADTLGANSRLITPGLFATMGIPIVRGRDFTWQDDPGHPGAIIVSARAAARFWPGADPIGRRVRVARAGAPWLTVVGVAGDVYDARDPEDPEETCYVPYAQNAASRAADDLHVMLRTDAASAGVIAGVRRVAARLDGGLAVYDAGMMDDVYGESLGRDRFGAAVTALFAGFGLLLATLGVYGVMAFGVAARRAEIGTRMSLGAEPAAIVAMVLRRGARLSGIGLGLGVFLAAAVTRAIASLLPDVRPAEPLVLAVAALTLLVASALAAYVPARRAAAIEPIVALRGD